jgi:predicted permease
MNWLARLLRGSELESQLDKELRHHIDQHAADLMARGLTRDEARRQARLTLGGPEQVKEACRDARGTRWLTDFAQDFRYALRTLRQKPAFAAVTILTLALGTGATTVMFTVINGVLLKPLPYANPDGLVNIQERTDWSTQFGNIWGLTYPNFVDCKAGARSLDMAAIHFGGGTVSAPGAAEYVESLEISAGLFSILGVPLFRGREFLPDDDRLAATPVAIISHNFWQRRFAASSSVLGTTMIFDGTPRTIVGVTPADFRLDGFDPFDIFTPIGQGRSPILHNRNAHGIGGWARLRPGAALAKANAELAAVGVQLAEQFPKSNKGRTFFAEPLRPDVGDARSTLWLLLGAVSAVLLIACANIASLLLARAVSRERELAMRVALGAGRARLARQCLTESFVLGLAGSALGVALASLGLRPFVTFWPGDLPRASEVRFDWHVLLFALAVSIASSFLFGLAPALRAAARDLEQTLRAGARNIAGASRRLHAAFVIIEIALAVVLLVCAGMLGRTLLRLSTLDPGINTHNLLIARAAISPSFTDPARIRAAWNEILDGARAVPGIQAIAIVDTVPMRQGSNQVAYSTTAAAALDNRQPLVLANSVTPDYLKVTGIPLRRGRFLTEQDRLGTQPVVVIDEILAQQAFPGQDPIGKPLWVRVDLNGTNAPATVVGIVGHVRQWGLANDDTALVRAQAYYAFAQVPDENVHRWSELSSIAVRTAVDPLTLVEPLRREIRGSANDQVIYQIRTMEQLAAATLDRQRFLLLLFGAFAALALLLASIGIYGVLAYLTSRRIPEIGVRIALGATSSGVVRLILRQSLGMITIGTMVGLFGAWSAGRLLQRLVEGMRPPDPMTFFGMIAVLVFAALLASYIPARRASRVDPLTALRQE